MSPRRSIREQLSQLQRDCRACTRCVEDGILPAANPTFEGSWDARLMLVGQAPGRHEIETRRPFSGRAGKELDRWMLRAGFESAADFRRRTSLGSTLFPYPTLHRAGGDRRPPEGAV